MTSPRRKIRPDSLIGSLPAEERAEVDRMLLDGRSAREVQEYLRELGHRLTTTGIYSYYHAHLGDIRLGELRHIAEGLASVPTDDMDAAIRQRVMQSAFELSLSPNADAAKLAALVKLVHAGEKVDILRRQLELAETRAAEVLLDRAKSPEVQRIVNGNASYSDKIAALRPLLFGNYEPLTPAIMP